MDDLNAIASLASILGLAISLYALYKVEGLSSGLKRHSRDRQLSEIIDKVVRLPASKPKLPASTAREVEFVVSTVRTFYVSRLPFRQKVLRALLDAVEAEIRGPRRLDVVQNHLRLVRDEITFR